MPLFGGSPVAAYAAVVDIRTPTVISLTADLAEELLGTDPSRKGHIVINSGSSNVTVLYGIADPTDLVAPATFKEAYQFTFKPGEGYLSDIPEIIPYSATSLAAAGELTIREFI